MQYGARMVPVQVRGRRNLPREILPLPRPLSSDGQAHHLPSTQMNLASIQARVLKARASMIIGRA